MKKAFLYLIFTAAFVGQALAQPVFTKTAQGAQYCIIKPGNGSKVKQGEVITFNYTTKNDRDSLLGSTFQRGRPEMVQVQPSRNVADLMDVFTLLSVNDSVLVRIPTDSAYVGHEEARPPFLPKGSFLNFAIKIERAQTLDEAMAERNAATEKAKTEQAALAAKMKGAESASTAKYITDKGISPQTTASGLKYVITSPATGRKPLAGDTLVVNYAGRTLDGKLFDSSIETVAKASGLQQPGRTYEPLKFVVGNSEVIRGWDEGLLLLNEGSKATFIIPSALAYGERGAGEDIKPYSPLVFDIELVKVIKGKPKLVKPAAAVKKAAGKKNPLKKPVVKKKVTRK
ncbi:FKBP-type peptidyl-prolyl cis-trans isomerase [Mucilaginibacter terrae]|uniref:FKBP-type peptidyl-prolyl cis-trans isomerase n=1 Tax=Mucilaginibacter terrae TaxID=1955052 RepID=UPI00362C4AF4